MLTEVKNQLKIVFLSTKYAIEREMLNKFTFISNVIFMILNNACFIVQWVILYSIKDNIGGYTFKQVILLWGLAAGTFGFSRFFFNDAFNLSDSINKGKLDTFLIQPKSVLLTSITSSVNVSALGDMIYAYIMLFIYGFSLKVFLLFTFFMVLGGIVVTAIGIIFNSLSFWFGRVEVVANTASNLMISFATYPEGIFKGLIKVLFYTLIPIGFVNYMPVKIIDSFNIIGFISVIGFATFVITLAIIVFNRGLRRYSSSNLMNARI